MLHEWGCQFDKVRLLNADATASTRLDIQITGFITSYRAIVRGPIQPLGIRPRTRIRSHMKRLVVLASILLPRCLVGARERCTSRHISFDFTPIHLYMQFIGLCPHGTSMLSNCPRNTRQLLSCDGHMVHHPVQSACRCHEPTEKSIVQRTSAAML